MVKTLNVAMVAEPTINPMCPKSPPAPPKGMPTIKSRVNRTKTNAEITSETIHKIFGMINTWSGLVVLLDFLNRNLQIRGVAQLCEYLQQRIKLEKLGSKSVNELVQPEFAV